MDTYDAIINRRSIRQFKNQPIEKEKVYRFLKAANAAPSAGNKQPWFFYVVKRKGIQGLKNVLERSLTERDDYDAADFEKKLENMSVPKVNGSKKKGMVAFFKNLGNAPLAIFVTIVEEHDQWKNFINTQDAAAATQNLILAAWNDGVGSCWMCSPIYKQEAIKKDLSIPPEHKLIAVIPLGYPLHIPPKPPKEDVSEKIVWLD